MPISTYISRDTLRSEFSAALSEMYRVEVPLYGDLVELVDEINGRVVQAQGARMGEWQPAGEHPFIPISRFCRCSALSLAAGAVKRFLRRGEADLQTDST